MSVYLIIWRATVMHLTRNWRPFSREQISSLIWRDHPYLTTPMKPPPDTGNTPTIYNTCTHRAVLVTAVDGGRSLVVHPARGYISFLPIPKYSRILSILGLGNRLGPIWDHPGISQVSQDTKYSGIGELTLTLLGSSQHIPEYPQISPE